jgi:hypothetical protein
MRDVHVEYTWPPFSRPAAGENGAKLSHAILILPLDNFDSLSNRTERIPNPATSPPQNTRVDIKIVFFIVIEPKTVYTII